MAQLTRSEMEAVIAQGGSVLFGGKVLTRLEHLPSEALLARGDPEAEAAAATRLQAQIEQLQAQIEQLQGAARPAAKTRKSEAKSSDEAAPAEG